MPYRELPNTIIGRTNVLEKTNEKASSTPAEQWAISTETQTKLASLYASMRQEIAERQEQFAKQAEASGAENAQQQVLLRIVSHFIRVFNMAVERGVFSPADRLYYGLNASQSDLPKLSTEQDLVTWARNLVAGEEKRTQQSAPEAPVIPVVPGTETESIQEKVPMSNPSAAEVEAELNKYVELSNAQSAEKQAFDAENKDVLDMLPEIDELIRDIYDEVEFYYRKETPANRRKLARQWGVVYVSRPGEEPEDEVVE
ncbi:hypothetical protein [Draconibacterium halophilum]|uniref:Uncharacterized protein n=1 Tax=Draconibacterium halophilum TaxID=2706887 RepID=A0A6C0RJ47_9BACT|nr:hypothetical protein [Draconibacterium halophilum]QIA09635.1 hypothetical protein G0Q07_18845 [Draconibacterium halophilum]